MGLSAETAYFFRHAILRDAAYQLQLPGDRAVLHALALTILESVFGGPPPGPLTDRWGELPCEPHPIDSIAEEIAWHARMARTLADSPNESIKDHEALYLYRAAEHCDRLFRIDDAIRLFLERAELQRDQDKAQSLCWAGERALESGRNKQAELLLAQALEISISSGNRQLEGKALGCMALLYQHTGRVDLAERTNEQALAVRREIGNRRAEGINLANLAIVYQAIRADRAGCANA